MPKSVPRWIFVAILGSTLIFPLLGSYGLWDPLEIREADVAQEVAKSGSFSDVSVDGRYSQRHPLKVWLIALGFKLFNVSELGGRLPLAILGLATLLLCYRVTRRLLGVGPALLGAFVLATTPTFLFQSRQLITHMPYHFAVLAAVGGLAAYLWPADGTRSRLDLGLGALGLVAGYLSQGLLVGTVFPLAALGIAVGLSWRSVNGNDPQGVWEPADGAHVVPGATVAQSLSSGLFPLLAAVLLAGIVIVALHIGLDGGTFALLGGEYRKLEPPPTFELTLKRLGFGFYPWIGLVPLALATFVLTQRRHLRPPVVTERDAEAPGYRDAARSTTEEPGHTVQPRAAFPMMLLLVTTAGAYVLASFWPAYLGQLRYPALPWLAVAVGTLVYHTMLNEGSRHRLWGIVALGLVLVVHQDYFMYPKSLAFAHVLDSPPKYPIELKLKTAVRIFGLLQAIAFLAALSALPRPVTVHRETRPTSRSWLVRLLAPVGRPLLRGLAFLVNQVVDGVTLVGGKKGRNFWIAAGLTALAFAGWCAFYLTPQLSLHMSNKALFQEFHACRGGGEKLAQYQVPGRGAAYYNDGQIEVVNSQTELFDLLGKPERWFILIPSSHLAPIDQAARRSQVPYYVLDERSSKYLLISNKLEGTCDKDHNPLRRYVLSQRPNPRKPITANFENRVKLLGYDVDDVVHRGDKFRITLYFQVLGRMPSGYKLFLHFDQPANRFHGDHVPLGGKLPTQYWLPGDYIVDPHDVEIPFITTPSGTYTIYMGFWLGSQRLKVVEGPNDGSNRVRIGTIQVR